MLHEPERLKDVPVANAMHRADSDRPQWPRTVDAFPKLEDHLTGTTSPTEDDMHMRGAVLSGRTVHDEAEAVDHKHGRH